MGLSDGKGGLDGELALAASHGPIVNGGCRDGNIHRFGNAWGDVEMIRRPLLIFSLVALFGCGGRDGAGDLVVETIEGELVVEDSVAGRSIDSVTLQSGDGRVTAVWATAVGASSNEILSQSVDPDLVVSGEPVSLSGNSTYGVSQPAACRESDSLAIAWAESLIMDPPPPGVTLDTGNVLAVFSWPEGEVLSGVLRVNANEIGVQRAPSVACLRAGRRAVTWTNECVAIRRIGPNAVVHFTPEECSDEPEDGTYLQLFDETGAPLGPSRLISGVRNRRAPVAPAESGDFVVLVDSTIQLWSSAGVQLDEVMDPDSNFSEGYLACAGKRCVAAVTDDDLSVWLIHANALRESSVVAVEESTQTSEAEVVRPRDGRVACDEGGVCLLTWLLERETTDGDVVLIESLGIYGRALDLRTGRLGEEVLLDGDNSTTSGVLVAAAGSGIFVTGSVEGKRLVLRRVRVP